MLPVIDVVVANRCTECGSEKYVLIGELLFNEQAYLTFKIRCLHCKDSPRAG
jgi:hypothetical protein